MNVAQAVAPEYIPIAKEMFARKAKENASSSYELEIIAKHGRKVMLEINSKLTFRNGAPFAVPSVSPAGDIDRVHDSLGDKPLCR